MVAVRPERPGDGAQVRAVLVAAFPSSAEADLVEQLRVAGDAVVALVAEDAGEIIGHILFSRMRVEADGRSVEALGLAPVAVVPQRQRQGIGSALIDAGLREAEASGAEIVFVVGEPHYYGRFGFDANMARSFASPYASPYFQAKLLRNNFTRPESGRADYAAAFAELE